ncbi:MAG: hypothetical protein HFJ74_04960 [Eggerthellaceae bacterium]|nr:hypothetical protein [Eggerthellaceae bacterium]
MITFAMVVGYLAVTLIVGLVMKRRAGKDKTVRNFFVANGKMPLFAVTTMLFADLIAASTTTGTAGTGYSTGLAALWGIWSSSFGCILFSVCFCRFFFEIRRTGAITGPEAFGIRFSQKIRYLVLVFTLIPLFIVFSAQITAASMYLASMLGIAESVATVAVLFLFLAMALLGITGIAEMNKVHAFVLLFGLTFAAIVCLNHVGGPQALVEKLSPSHLDLFSVGLPTVLAQFVGGALGFSISVTSINIGYCAKDIKTAERSHVIVAVASAVFAFAPAIIGLCAAVSLEGIRNDNALFAMTSSISPELAGIAVMAVFAAIFSTGPWFLLATSKLVVQELYVPLSARAGHEVSDRSALRMSRVVIVVTLVLAVLASGTNVSLLNSLMSASQIKAIAVVLLLFGIYWKRTSNAAGFVGLLVGGTLSTAWYVLGSPLGVQPFWPGVVSSVAIIVVGSLVASRKPVSDDYVAYEQRLAAAQEEFAACRRAYDARAAAGAAGAGAVDVPAGAGAAGPGAGALSGAGAAGPGVEAPAGVPAVEEDGVSRDISAAG